MTFQNWLLTKARKNSYSQNYWKKLHRKSSFPSKVTVSVMKELIIEMSRIEWVEWVVQKQPPRGVPRKGVLKIHSKFTGEHPGRSAILIKLLCNFIEITLWHGCSPVNLLHIFRTAFLKNTSVWLLLVVIQYPYITSNW